MCEELKRHDTQRDHRQKDPEANATAFERGWFTAI